MKPAPTKPCAPAGRPVSLKPGSVAPKPRTVSLTLRTVSLKLGALALISAAVFGAAAPARAHHSFAMYEPTKTLTFNATVKAFQWTNPHTILWVLVQPKDGGPAQEWSLETTSPGVLTRAGWTRQSIKAGDRVSVTFESAARRIAWR